ncbi:MAG: hypothetical protein HY692_02885, partial [Cyanobacteria bacterium NC_groundwater_1444_Ag_S-0.65um_54_12]|nr:hypothetical protein [Cyanobacteria bacterium NC_groundwater_1444_Ag_S-0.65um_54_12]
MRELSVIAVMLMTMVGCSSSSPTSPGGVGANLPAATGQAPTAKSNEAIEKQTIKGRVLDALTGEPLNSAVILVEEAELPNIENTGLTSPVGTDSASSSPGAPNLGLPPASSGNKTADSARGRPPAKASAQPAVKVSTDEKGNFEIKDLPAGTYAITAHHKGFVAVTFLGGRPASGRLQIALLPQVPAAGHDLAGNIRLLNNKPAAGVSTAVALRSMLFAGGMAVSDPGGSFTLSGLPSGKYLLAAWTPGDAGEIRAWGMQREVNVAVGKDKKSSHPEIILRAVAKPVVLAGKVTAPSKMIRPRQVQAFLATDDGAELLLMTKAPDQDGYFRFSLPALVEGTTYHLVASGVSTGGNAAHAHLHNLAGPSHSHDLVLPDLPATPSFTTAEGLVWTWPAMPNVSVYRLRLESTGDDGKTLWEGWTTGTKLTLPGLPALALRHGDPYRYTLSAIRTQGAFELPEVGFTPWTQAASLVPREFIAGEEIKIEEPVERLPDSSFSFPENPASNLTAPVVP